MNRLPPSWLLGAEIVEHNHTKVQVAVRTGIDAGLGAKRVEADRL